MLLDRHRLLDAVTGGGDIAELQEIGLYSI